MSFRVQRMAEEVQKEVSSIISKLKDPRIGFVTVTRVEMSADLGHAKVFVGILGDEKLKQETLKALQHSAGFVRREIGKRIRARITPGVHFILDRGLDASDRVAQLLHEVHSADAEVARAQGVEAGHPEPTGEAEAEPENESGSGPEQD